MPNAAAGSREKQCAARLVGGLRGHFLHSTARCASRIKARLTPWLTRCVAAELNAIMQTERPILPELHDQRHEPVAGPIRGAGNSTEREFGGRERDGLLEGMPALER